MIAMGVPTVKFNNGVESPAFGLGTWKSQPGEVTQAVKVAIEIGYRHIDGAHIYQNEKEVGIAIAEKIKDGTIKREDLFVTSKLWNNSHRREAVEPAIRVTLKNLGLDYVDLYLIHWPFAFKEGDDLFPMNADNTFVEEADIDYIDTWKGMEDVYDKKLAKSIGISNFNKRQIERLLANCTVVPATNQVECSPYLNQKKLIEYCASKNITVTAYSPLGSPDRPNRKAEDEVLLDDSTIKGICEKYGKTSAQIVLRYQVQRGLLVIPKSVNKHRIMENFQIFDFCLEDKDMQLLDSLDRNGRTCIFEITVNVKEYPFNDEY